ncbi:MAG: helix-turn-helix domain-containing protein [Pseudonocardiales bacterium]
MAEGRDGEAARLLRRARTLSRLTQSELAHRVGISQSVVSAYESGRRQPSMPTLRRLIEATGQALVVVMVPTRALVPPNTARGRAVRQHRSAVCRVAARRGATVVPARSLRPEVAATVEREAIPL